MLVHNMNQCLIYVFFPTEPSHAQRGFSIYVERFKSMLYMFG